MLQGIKHYMLSFTLLEMLSRLFVITIISLAVLNKSKSLLNFNKLIDGQLYLREMQKMLGFHHSMCIFIYVINYPQQCCQIFKNVTYARSALFTN